MKFFSPKNCLTMRRTLFLAVLIIGYFIAPAAAASLEKYPADKIDWQERGQADLRDELAKQQRNTNVAKNVILFIGDGMGLSTITASRIYEGQTKGKSGEENVLSFEKFPHVALSKTYNTDNQVADSAGTATAMLSGVKTDYGIVGLSQEAKRFDCNSQKTRAVPSIGDWARVAGKHVGVVTTTRITHATPACLYAHAADRYWENDAELTPEAKGQCKDIAVQLIEDGRYMRVILGSGRRNFINSTETDVEYPEKRGKRTDGRDLVKEWQTKHKDAKNKYRFVWNETEFKDIDIQNTDYLMGLFDYNHMQYEIERQTAKERGGEPSLKEMTNTAIKMLQKSDKGYFLLVEGGRIDHGHHDGFAKKALADTVALSDAVEEAVRLTEEKDTLMVVTADHSHVFTIGGYPGRGNNIFNVQDNDKEKPLDNIPYHTLGYANSPSYGRKNITTENITVWEHPDYRVPALVPVAWETHGGEDVAIFARGPMSHLFNGVKEQNYIAHVMGYAACIGANKEHCAQTPPPATCGADTLHIGCCIQSLCVLLLVTLSCAV